MQRSVIFILILASLSLLAHIIDRSRGETYFRGSKASEGKDLEWMKNLSDENSNFSDSMEIPTNAHKRIEHFVEKNLEKI